MFLTQHLYFLKPGDSTPGPSVNPLYSKCNILKFADNIKLSNFLFAHDSIKSNLPTSFCDSITTNIPILQKSRSKSGKYSYCKNKKPVAQILLNPNLLILGSFCKSLLTGYFITGYV